MPVFPPVTQTTLPVRSGMSLEVHLGVPGKISLSQVERDIDVVNYREASLETIDVERAVV